MADFPDSIFSPRVVENLPGIEYVAEDLKTGFAEDINNPNAEIVAIEETLGTNPEGDFASVKARLENIEDDVQEKVSASMINSKVMNGGGTTYVLPGWIIPTAANNTQSAGWLRYIPIFVGQPTTYDQIHIVVSTLGAGNVRVGLYTWNNGGLGNLIEDFGLIDVSGTGQRSLAIDITLQPGYYWLATFNDVAYTSNSATTAAANIGPMEGFSNGTTMARPLHMPAYNPFGEVDYVSVGLPSTMPQPNAGLDARVLGYSFRIASA